MSNTNYKLVIHVIAARLKVEALTRDVQQRLAVIWLVTAKYLHDLAGKVRKSTKGIRTANTRIIPTVIS